MHAIQDSSAYRPLDRFIVVGMDCHIGVVVSCSFDGCPKLLFGIANAFQRIIERGNASNPP
jgi:hypothetical protein